MCVIDVLERISHRENVRFVLTTARVHFYLVSTFASGIYENQQETKRERIVSYLFFWKKVFELFVTSHQTQRNELSNEHTQWYWLH